MRWLINAILIFLPFLLVAQKDVYLSVKSQKRPVGLKFEKGAEIRLKIDNEPIKYVGIIEEIGDSSFTFNGINIAYNRVDQVIIPRKLAKALKAGAWSSIPFFITITALDRGINRNESPLVDETAIRLSSLYLLIGGVAYSVQNRKINLGKRWKMAKLDLSPP